MPSRDCLTATSWKWRIFTGSVRLNTPPTPALASASVIWPSESSWTCCSFSSSVIFASSALTLRSIVELGAVRAGASAASSLDCVAATTPAAAPQLSPGTASATASLRLCVPIAPPRPRGPPGPPYPVRADRHLPFRAEARLRLDRLDLEPVDRRALEDVALGGE